MAIEGAWGIGCLPCFASSGFEQMNSGRWVMKSIVEVRFDPLINIT